MNDRIGKLITSARNKGASEEDLAKILHNRPDLRTQYNVGYAVNGNNDPIDDLLAVEPDALDEVKVTAERKVPAPVTPETPSTDVPYTQGFTVKQQDPNLDTQNTIGSVQIPDSAPPQEKEFFSAAETFISGQMKYNSQVSGLVNYWSWLGATLGGERDDPNFDVFEHKDKMAGYPPKIFVGVESTEEMDRIKRQYDRDDYVTHNLERAGWEGTVSSVAGGAANPLYLIPFLGWGGRGTNIGRAAAAGKYGVEGATGEALAETLYHAADMDLTRTTDESVFNIAAGAITGSVLGGLLNKKVITQEEFDEIAKGVQKNFDFIGPRKEKEMAEWTTVESLKDVPEVDQIKGVSSWLSKLTPVDILASPAGAARKLGALLGEQTIMGTSRASIETMIKRSDAFLGEGLYKTAEQWHTYKKSPHTSAKKMSKTEFYEQVGDAMRNGDIHAVPEVEAAARHLRQEVMEPMRKQAVKAGLLKSDVDTAEFAESYFPRQYNYGLIELKSGEFMDDLVGWFKGNKEYSQFDIKDIRQAAAETKRKLLDPNIGNPLDSGKFKITAGPLKGRTVAVPDNLLSKWLINEPDIVLRGWTRDLSAQIELTKMFGDTSMNKVFNEVADEWDEMIEAASRVDPKAGAKMSNRKKKDIELLEALRDRLLNQYALPKNPRSTWVQAGRAMRNLNILRLLGGMTISAFPDAARPLYHHNMNRYAKVISTMATNPEFRKMATADLRRMGVALDMVIPQRLQSIAEMDAIGSQTNRAYAGIDRMVVGTGGGSWDFGRVSGMSYWNTSAKTLTGVMSQDGLIDNILRNQKFAKKLRSAGISDEMAVRMKEQYNKYGETVQGLRIGNSDKWDDAMAAEMFETTIMREVDATIVTPGIMDKPLWMSSEVGKVVGQLKSFGFAATNKQLLAGINNQDILFYQGVLAATSLGSMTYMIKRILAGHDPDMAPEDLVMRGIEYSGAIGFGTELIQAGMGSAQLAGLYKGEGNFRWARQGMWGSLLGPSAGLMEDGFRAQRNLFKEEPNAGDVNALRRLVPYNNLHVARKVFDAAEKAYKDRLGISE